VASGGVRYYANCAWDVFGIATVLDRDVSCIAVCPYCSASLDLSVEGGALRAPAGVVHFVVPPKRFWENIHFT
jgi:hypothetical protein